MSACSDGAETKRCDTRTAIFEADRLSVAWGDKVVIEDVSIELHAGEMICLVGRSGSGKTSLFHALSGLIEPKSGNVRLNGEDITGKPGHVSYMLQKDLLLEQRTIVDNVALPLLVKGEKKAAARRSASALFEEFGLDGTQDRYPFELSGGMRQRAALLRTYMNNSEVVLMDEPFSALDALTRADMRKWFLGVMERLHFASILITHDVDEAIALADRVIVLGAPKDHPTLPSHILGTVDIECSRKSRDDFILSAEALDVKKKVMSYLQAK